MTRSISDIFKEFQATLPSRGEQITLAEILEAFHERGFGFLLLFFAVPMALPFPVPPGINVLLATPLILLTAQQALGRHTIWFPEKIKRKQFKTKSLDKLITGALPWMKRVEYIIRPRLGYITQGVFSNIIGVLGLIMALTVCIPLPMTNTVPSFGIAMMAVGVLMRDGLAVLVGASVGTLWVAMLAAAALFLGEHGIDALGDFIKNIIGLHH